MVKKDKKVNKEAENARKEFEKYAKKVDEQREKQLDELEDLGEDPNKKKIILGVVGAVVTLAIIIPLISYAVFKYNM